MEEQPLFAMRATPGSAASTKHPKNTTAAGTRQRPFCVFRYALQRRLDFEAPGFQQGFRNILRVLVAPCPLTQAGRANVLIRRQLELLHRLFERCNYRDDRPDGLRLAPVRITASLCHIKFVLPFRGSVTLPKKLAFKKLDSFRLPLDSTS